MTDLVPGRLGSALRGGGEQAGEQVRTRIVLDTSVLVADPGCIAGFDGRRRRHPADRHRGAGQPQDPARRRRPGGAHRAAGDRGAARPRTAARWPSRCRSTTGRRGTLRIEINGVQKHLLVEHGLDPAVPDNRIIGAALGQADARPDARWCPTTPPCASRPRTSGVEAAEHQPASGAAGRPGRRAGSTVARRPSDRLPATRPVDALYSRRRVDGDAVDAACRRTSSPCCAAGRSRRWPAAVDGELVLLGHAAPEAWGLRAALEGAALRPRAAARPRRQRRRPRRARRHRQDAAGHRRRAGAGRRAAHATSASPSTARSCRSGRADVGFLPGGLDEKLDPWMSAIHDAIVALTDQRSSTRRPPPGRRADQPRASSRWSR